GDHAGGASPGPRPGASHGTLDAACSTIAEVHAIIIAGGFGTRLRPLTTRHPKHVLPVAGVPFLMHQISKLADAGITDVVLAASYRADQFDPLVVAAKSIGVTLRV